MCAFCHCTRHSHGLGDTNIHTWKRRTNEEYHRDAKRYANAQDPKDRKDVFTETGIRYSELLHLKYFDPSRFVIVDAMHNLFLGLIQEHFEILGMKLEDTKEETCASYSYQKSTIPISVCEGAKVDATTDQTPSVAS